MLVLLVLLVLLLCEWYNHTVLHSFEPIFCRS